MTLILTAVAALALLAPSSPTTHVLGQDTACFTSFTTFQQASPSSATTVVYDNERWSGTPLVEQQHPGLYERRFVRLALARGLHPILAPALSVGTATQVAKAYVGTGVAGTYVIQTQTREHDLTAFAALFNTRTNQARALHPRIRVMADLSTGLAVGYATGPELVAAARSIHADGDWLGVNAADPVAVSDMAAFLTLEAAS